EKNHAGVGELAPRDDLVVSGHAERSTVAPEQDHQAVAPGRDGGVLDALDQSAPGRGFARDADALANDKVRQVDTRRRVPALVLLDQLTVLPRELSCPGFILFGLSPVEKHLLHNGTPFLRRSCA